MSNSLLDKLEKSIKLLSKKIDVNTINTENDTIEKLEKAVNKYCNDLNIYFNEKLTKENFESITLQSLCILNTKIVKKNRSDKLIGFYTRKYNFKWEHDKIDELFLSLMK